MNELTQFGKPNMRVALCAVSKTLNLTTGDTLTLNNIWLRGKYYTFTSTIRTAVQSKKGDWIYVVTNHKGVVKEPIIKSTSNPRTTTHFEWLSPEQQVRVILTFLDTGNEIKISFDG